MEDTAMTDKWTRDDLPEEVEYTSARGGHCLRYLEPGVRDSLADYLNTHHPKPKVGVEINYHWRNPDAIDVIEKLTRERDAAVARTENAERERDEVREQVRNIGEGMVRAQNQRGEMRRERDEAAERAAVAERERDVRGELLDEIAEAVYGLPPTDGWWEWGDLAEKVRGLKEQAGFTGVDPVTEKARELYEVVRTPEWRDWDQLNDADHDEYYRLAHHVLGQEAER